MKSDSEGHNSVSRDSRDIIVSCLTVTRGRVDMLARAVECFRSQTVERRELVIVYGVDDPDTAKFVQALRDPQIRCVAAKQHRLGWLRNVAVANARGEFVAVWDDDDWSPPDRLHEQLKAIERSGKAACLLSQCTVYDAVSERAYTSHVRPWEGSLMVRRSAIPSYDGSLSRFEDTPVVDALIHRDQVELLNRPDLYVYVYHGTNTWDADHFGRFFAISQPLSDDQSASIASQLRLRSRNVLVSCLTVTRRRVGLLARAVACFRSQTVESRELVIVYDGDDTETARYVEGLGDPQIRGVKATKRHRLGWLRNIAVSGARGEFVAQWDDDDWSSPNRLQAQLRAIRNSGKDACALSRWTVYDTASERSYLSYVRPWEGSLVARRSALPNYDGSLSRAEDTPVVETLVERGQLVLLNRPDLYIYVHHGANTWEASHFQDLLARSRPLSDRHSKSVASRLAQCQGAPKCDTAKYAATQ
jgi:glycosyltransferase involved in cell wall biosynthesis